MSNTTEVLSQAKESMKKEIETILDMRRTASSMVIALARKIEVAAKEIDAKDYQGVARLAEAGANVSCVIKTLGEDDKKLVDIIQALAQISVVEGMTPKDDNKWG